MSVAGFGYRFIADELAAVGFTESERRVWRACSENEIFSAFVRKRHGKGRATGPPVRDDLVRREFPTSGPDRPWLTDTSEHPTGEGKLHLSAVKDVWSNRIVGYSINERMTSELAVSALRMAIQRRNPTGTTIHREDLRLAIATRIERTYHRRRRQRVLGKLTRVELEAVMTTQVTSAA